MLHLSNISDSTKIGCRDSWTPKYHANMGTIQNAAPTAVTNTKKMHISLLIKVLQRLLLSSMNSRIKALNDLGTKYIFWSSCILQIILSPQIICYWVWFTHCPQYQKSSKVKYLIVIVLLICWTSFLEYMSFAETFYSFKLGLRTQCLLYFHLFCNF